MLQERTKRRFWRLGNRGKIQISRRNARTWGGYSLLGFGRWVVRDNHTLCNTLIAIEVSVSRLIDT